jgi:hypothetical protein
MKLGLVALDGSKVKANASKHKAMSYGRMDETEKFTSVRTDAGDQSSGISQEGRPADSAIDLERMHSGDE